MGGRKETLAFELYPEASHWSISIVPLSCLKYWKRWDNAAFRLSIVGRRPFAGGLIGVLRGALQEVLGGNPGAVAHS